MTPAFAAAPPAKDDAGGAPAGEPALVRVHGVHKAFDVSPPWLDRVVMRTPRRVLRAVDGVDFEVRRGETVALVGESGCGKSTLARIVVGLTPATHGGVEFRGAMLYGEGARADAATLARARASMQMIFQDPYASLNPRWRIAAIVAEPIVAAEPSRSRASVAERVATLLEQVGLAAADRHKYPHQFSGGQRQRISIARALSTAPAFVVCDEPTSALDVSVQAQVLNLMCDLKERRGLAYLFISHNLAVVHHIADRVLVMYLGRIVEAAPRRELFAGARHPYTQMLLDAVPDPHKLATRALPAADAGEGDAVCGAGAASELPDPLNLPGGCGFHPRCVHADARCRAEAPALVDVAPGHQVACHAVAERRIDPLALAAALRRPGIAAA
ncbi:MAG TPA: oligopeptide/dipeptide ABC transporter ATP-binding protein [Casimicrobiaceae bacterium]|nr:oligopeptide/dipeptide ABC transporter ATP-binding protein [Casimicrobiaceae bacterium]